MDITILKFRKFQFAIIYFLIFLLFPNNAQAALVSFSSMTLTDSNGGTITIVPGGVELIRCYGRVTNSEGLAEIDSLVADYWGPSANYSTPQTIGLRYYNDSCTLSTVTSTTFDYECDTYIEHNMEPGTWTCLATATDSQGVRQRNATRTVSSTRSIGVYNSYVDFGNLSAGANTSTDDIELKIYNYGNVYLRPRLDAYRVSGTANDANSMACDNGNIPIGNMRFNMTPNIDIQDKTPMINAVQTINYYLNATNFGETAITNASIYLGLILPTTVSGQCSGIISITATT